MPRLGMGTWMLGEHLSIYQQEKKALQAGLDTGFTLIDTAEMYGNGLSEKLIGDTIQGYSRETLFLVSKVYPHNAGRPHIYDSIDQTLHNLKTDYLDVLLLHRPDVLFEPEEVAAAFDQLEAEGKVRYFGVSNLVPMQIELLKKYVKQPLVFNQVQLSLDQSQLIDQALYMNNKSTDFSINRDGNLLDYCRLHDITIQAWSPLQFGMFKGTFIDHPDFPELNKVLAKIGEREGVSKTAVALAWILRHPAKMQVIIGTMNPEHIVSACDASKVQLSHHDWYELYLAAGKYLP